MRNKRALFAIPYVVWMALFVVAPIIMVVIYAFTTADFGGSTLANFPGMGTYTVHLHPLLPAGHHRHAHLPAHRLSPGLCDGQGGPRFQRIATVLIMLPMWVNFLLRTYAWMSILENNGLLNQLL